MSENDASKQSSSGQPNLKGPASGDAVGEAMQEVKAGAETHEQTRAKTTDAPQRPTRFHSFMREHFPDAKPHDHWTLAFTGVIAASTLLYTIVAGWTLVEIHSGSGDTHDLAVAAGRQADQSSAIADAAKSQACSAKQIADASLRNAKAAERFSGSADSINTQTRAAVSEFHRLANASENTVKTNLEIARLEERPWIVAGLTLPAIDVDKSLPMATVNVVNSGRTFAKNVIVESYANFSPIIPTEIPSQLPPVTEKSVAVVAPNIQYTNAVNWPSATLSLKQIYPLMSITNDWYILIWGRVIYEDVFKTPSQHTTKFCAYRKLSDPSQPLQCAFGNDAD